MKFIRKIVGWKLAGYARLLSSLTILSLLKQSVQEESLDQTWSWM